jgi:hypothetical protein
MEMLCIAAEAQPTGYLLVNGRTLSTTGLALLTGAPEAEIQSALAELGAAGVYSRDRKGRIYSRRMVRETKRAAVARKNGKLGGNPSLRKLSEKPPPDNPPVKAGDKPQRPIAKIQESKKQDSDDLPRASARAGSPVAADNGGLDPAERKNRWIDRMMREAHATMPPRQVSALWQALMEDRPPAWAKAELERLNRLINGRRKVA